MNCMDIKVGDKLRLLDAEGMIVEVCRETKTKIICSNGEHFRKKDGASMSFKGEGRFVWSIIKNAEGDLSLNQSPLATEPQSRL